MTTDATGQEIVIGEYYGYSTSKNGFTRVITGKAFKVCTGKVTLIEITEKRYLYASSNPEPDITKSDRKRTLAAVQVFYISKHLMIDKNAPEHICEPIEDGMLYRCSICNEIL